MMKRLTALIVTFVFVMTMALALPANAATIPADGVFVANSTNCSIASSSTVSYGDGYACVPNGQYLGFNVGLTESGTYKITARQISWDMTAAYKLFVNDMPEGVVSVGNTLGAQQDTTVELGTFELLDGENYIQLIATGAPTSVWIYNITITKVGELTGDSISVYYGNTTHRSKVGTGWDTHVQSATAGVRYTVDVPAAGDYKVYFASANYAANPSKVNLYYTPNGGTEVQAASNVQLPSHDEWGAFDKAYVGDVSLAAGSNTVSVTLASGTSMRPRSIMIEKVAVGTVTYTSGLNGDSAMDKNGQARYELEITRKGTYAIIADIATNAGEVDLQLFQYINKEFPNIGYTSVQSDGYTSFKTGIVLATKEFDVGNTNFYIKSLTGIVRVKNVRVVETESEPTTKLYLGTDITATKEMTTLRKGTITVQTTLPDESQDAIMIAVLYENGEIVSAVPVTTKDGATLTGTLDASNVSNINACYVKVFVWDSLDNLTPLAKVLAR